MTYAKPLIGALMLAACASAEGTKPHDMSTAQHEAAAANEEASAQGHGAQYEPGASSEVQHCDPKRSICWTSTSNPTEKHRVESEDHEKLAQQHRAAAQALRDAEAASCAGLSEKDRVTSPFFHREDISAVRKAELTISEGQGTHQQFAGGTAVFRAVPGLTAEWLQRLVNCHIARAASVGFDMPEMPYCPLVLKGVTANVSSTGDGFALTVTSTDAKTADEIWRRIERLK